MFVAWRDIRCARGRFAVIGAVVALITILVGFLTGLTAGLAAQNVSAILSLPGDQLVLGNAADGSATFSASALSQSTIDQWRAAPGVRQVLPIGIVQSRATVGKTSTGVALFGLSRGVESTTVTTLAPGVKGTVGVSSGAAKELHVARGGTVFILGSSYRVSSVGGDASFSHTPVVAMTPADWARANAQMGGSGAATVLAVTGSPDWSRVARETHTTASPPLLSLSALETFRSEIGSLGLMVAMLLGISAMVVAAFFTVWTLQRAGDIAVMKALGATQRSLILDALGQALVVLVVGIGLGTVVTVGLGALAAGSVPFVVSVPTVVLPAVVMTVLGLLGAALALRTVTKADPLAALGSNR